MAPPTEGECANCQSSTKKYCNRCKLVDRDDQLVSAVFYCSKTCQTTDYANHKLSCLDRVQLFRGAKLLQQVLYTFRELGFDLDISDVEHKEGKLHTYERYFNARKNPGPVFAFPDHLLLEPKDRAALLTYMACSDSQKYLHELTRKVLKGKTTLCFPRY